MSGGYCQHCERDGSAPTVFAPRPDSSGAPAGAGVVSAPDGNSPRTSAGLRPGGGNASSDSGRGDSLGLVPGTLLASRYRIVAPIGRGGMGQVYRAEDLKLGETVALKFLPESLANDPVWLNRFFLEVRTAREVTHPNVCRVHDVVETTDGSGHPLNFLTMEYVDGENLADLIRRFGRLPTGKAMEIAAQITAALAAAHARGVLHRDIKPANVLIDGRGQAKLADFGLALGRQAAPEAEVAGTPGYIAPELLRGHVATGRSDLYALGLVLYELLTGRRAVKDGKPVTGSIRQYAPDVSPEAERAVLACVEPDPAKRPASAAEVAEAFPVQNALEAALARGETPSPEMVAESADEEPMPLWKAWTLLGGICAVLLVTWAISSYGGFLQFLPPVLSPEEMVQQAKEILRDQGFPTRNVNRGSFVAENFPMLDWYSTSATRDQRTQFAQAPQGSLLDTYQQSATESLTPTHLTMSLLGVPLKPPASTGIQSVQVDSNGHVLDLLADPVGLPPPAAGSAVDWNKLLVATGMDPSTIKPAKADFTPLFPETERHAWTGSYPGHPEFIFPIEASAWQGRVTRFAVLGSPWAIPHLGYNRFTEIGTDSFQFAGFAVSVLLAFANFRNGKGDLRSATRLASLLFVSVVLFGLFAVPFSAGNFADWLGALFSTVATGMVAAALLWLAYVAVEPLTRRRLPGLLLASSLLLQNRWKSPRIGKEVLVGMLLGVLSSLYFQVCHAALWPFFKTASLDVFPAAVLNGASSLVAGWSFNFMNALGTVAEIAVLFTLLLVVVRRPWLAAILLTPGVIWIADARANVFLGAAIALGLFAPVVYVLLRYGVTAAAIAFFFSEFSDALPWTHSWSSWLVPYVAADIGLILVVAAFGLWIAIGARSPFGHFRLEA